VTYPVVSTNSRHRRFVTACDRYESCRQKRDERLFLGVVPVRSQWNVPPGMSSMSAAVHNRQEPVSARLMRRSILSGRAVYLFLEAGFKVCCRSIQLALSTSAGSQLNNVEFLIDLDHRPTDIIARPDKCPLTNVAPTNAKASNQYRRKNHGKGRFGQEASPPT